MTGAIDQLGHIQPVGAVAEKIEGFFDICRAVGAGTAGSQGVIIPRSTVEDLMLRQDVAEACGQGKFHVYAVGTIHEALQILTGRSIGQPDESGAYPEGTLLHDAQHKAKQYWHMTMAGPNDPG
jgi:ATP-dependent Lon protease